MYKTNILFWPFLFVIDVIGHILFFWRKFYKMQKNPQKIVVIKLDHIGDMILASSFFRNLKKNYPSSSVTVVCRSLTKPVAECISYIDEIVVLDVPWFSRKESIGWLSTMSFAFSNWNKYDLAFELHTDPRNILLASILGKYSVSYGVRSGGFLLNKVIKWDDKHKHIVLRNLDILKGIGKKVDNGHLELKIDKEEIDSAKKKLGISSDNFVIVHPLSGREEKNKSWSFWNDRIKKLSKNIVLIGGSKEEAVLIEENINLSKNVINTCGKISLKEYLGLLSVCTLAISPDTFVVHARSAFKRKVEVVPFEGYDREGWGYFR